MCAFSVGYGWAPQKLFSRKVTSCKQPGKLDQKTSQQQHKLGEKQVGRKPWKSGRNRWRSSPKTPRLLALDQLLRIEEDAAFIGLIEAGNKKTTLDLREIGFTRKIVNGVTKQRRVLDSMLATVCNRPLKKLDPEMLQILRIGAYELAYSKAPAYVMNEVVNITKIASANPRNVGFANAVLNSLARKRDSGENLMPDLDLDKSDSIAEFHSHPTWMVDRWIAQFGLENTIKLLEWNNRPPHYGLRPTQLCTIPRDSFLQYLQDQGVEAAVSKYLPEEFFHISGGMQAIINGTILTDGYCAVQDESAALVVALLDPQPGERILDACAAPGGKTMFAAERMGGQGEIVACDVKKGRLKALKSAVVNQEMQDLVKVSHQDLKGFPVPEAGDPQNGSFFDKVLVDAPCSGSGVLSRRSDMRWRRVESDLQDLNVLQGDLLHAGSRLVAPGGVLVYSTCSMEVDENEEQVTSFLRSHPDFVLDSNSPVHPSVKTPEGLLKTLPFLHGIDGAFGARMLRKK